MAYNYPTKKTSYEAFPETRDFVLAVAKGDYPTAKKRYDYLVEKGWQNRHIYSSYYESDYFDNVLDQYRLSPEEYNKIYKDSGLSSYDSGAGKNRTGYSFHGVMASYNNLAENYKQETQLNESNAQERRQQDERRQQLEEAGSGASGARRNLDSSQRMLTGRNRGDGQTMLTRGYQRRTLMGG